MKTKASTEEIVIGIPVLAWIANYISAKQFAYPFLYCWLSPAGASLYMAWGTLAMFIVVAGVVFNALVKSILKAFMWALVGVAVIELPHLADYLFRLGASCD